MAVAELPLKEVAALISGQEEHGFELEASAPVSAAAPLQGRPFVSVTVRHWGGEAGRPAPPPAGSEGVSDTEGTIFQLVAENEEHLEDKEDNKAAKLAVVEEVGGGVPPPLAHTQADVAEQRQEDQVSEGPSAPVEDDSMFRSRSDSDDEEREAGWEGVLPPAPKPCRLHVHIWRASGLRPTLVNAELASVQKDDSSALTEAVESGPNSFSEIDLGFPGCAAVQTQFDVETCALSFNFHSDLNFVQDGWALAHLADEACQVALLHRAPVAGDGG